MSFQRNAFKLPGAMSIRAIKQASIRNGFLANSNLVHNFFKSTNLVCSENNMGKIRQNRGKEVKNKFLNVFCESSSIIRCKQGYTTSFVSYTRVLFQGF